MSFTIGGEFEISIDHLISPIVDHKSLPFQNSNHYFLNTGRSAIYIALQEIIKKGGKKEAWLPRFCCESVLMPFFQLGFKIHFYSTGDRLQTPRLLPDNLNDVTFLFIHYFGKKNHPILNWLKGLSRDEHSFFIIEDCVQASLSTNVGLDGDFIVTSFRKFLPLPDGALLACQDSIRFDLDPPDEGFISDYVIGKMIREHGGDPDLFLELFHHAENRINKLIQPRDISEFSRFLFDRTNIGEVSEVRRRNWNYLLSLLQSDNLTKEFIDPLFNILEDGEVPLGLPVKVAPEYRDKLRKFLMSYSIYCPIHWQIDETVDPCWESEISLSHSILTFPIDQRLTLDALEYFTEKLRLFFKEMI